MSRSASESQAASDLFDGARPIEPAAGHRPAVRSSGCPETFVNLRRKAPTETMHRELLSQPYIGSYSALLLLALVGGYLLLRWRCVRLGM